MQDALFAFVAPCYGAGLQVGGVFFGVFEILLNEVRLCAFEDEEAHEVEVVADGEASVEGELEAVAGGEACAEVVAAHLEVVGSGTAQRNGIEGEVVGEGCLAALPLGVEACTETGGFGDEGKVAWCVLVVLVVVVDVFDVLVEADVEFPLVGELALDGADSSAQVEFANGGVFRGEVEEHVEVEAVVGAWAFPEIEVVEVVAVVEADVEIGDVAEEAFFGVGMCGADVVDVAVACAYLKAIGHGLFALACVEGVHPKHLAGDDAVKASYGVCEGAEKFTHYTFGTSLGVVEEDV